MFKKPPRSFNFDIFCVDFQNSYAVEGKLKMNKGLQRRKNSKEAMLNQTDRNEAGGDWDKVLNDKLGFFKRRQNFLLWDFTHELLT